MIVKTCLLVTDDADDHHTFSEAIGNICSDVVVLIIVDPAKAIKAITSSHLLPEYLLLDMDANGMDTLNVESVLEEIYYVKKIPTLLYGSSQNLKAVQRNPSVQMDKDFEYSELVQKLKDFLI